MVNGWPRRLAIAVAATLALPGVSAGGLPTPNVCSVSIDKQVDCGGGFVDIGDVDESCIGWNRIAAPPPPIPAENIAVRWVVENTGEDDLVNCRLAESNPALLPASNIGAIPPGEMATQTVVRACSNALSANEPDTAEVVCDCATDQPGDPPVARTAVAADRADFDCQTPRLNVANRCVPQLDPMGNLTFDFEIDVENPGNSDGATLDNCVLTDGLELGECTPEADPDPIFTEDLGTLLPGSLEELIFTQNIVDSLSCNVATVSCDIGGSTGEDGPKRITVRTDTECAPEPPLSGCRSAEKQTASIRSGKRFNWKWKKGEATSKFDFGDPTTDTDYQVCLYYSGFGFQKRPSCSNVPAGVGWKESKKGYKFKSNDNTDGISQIKLKEGEAGKAKILVKNTDERVLLPLTETVVVQISNSEGECWESLFPTFKKNSVKKFFAK